MLLELVGRGGMGEVYSAYDPALDRRVALKVLHWDTQGNQRLAQRLLRAAKAITRLRHANVVAVYDAGTIDGRVFVAMEFLDGQTVADWMRAAPARATWHRVLEVFQAAGRGLAAAHAGGIIHRDFKPQNLMIDKDGGVRVMDFGLARWSAEDDSADQPAPSPGSAANAPAGADAAAPARRCG
jgi:serine/threonine protein kinase